MSWARQVELCEILIDYGFFNPPSAAVFLKPLFTFLKALFTSAYPYIHVYTSGYWATRQQPRLPSNPIYHCVPLQRELFISNLLVQVY